MRHKALWIILVIIAIVTSLQVAIAQTSVTAVVVNEFANVRVVPAIGADVRGTVPAGWLFEFVTGRSPDNEWLRVDFNGDEGWVNVATLTIFGDVSTLRVADPRTIPYGGFETPRAGLTSASSEVTARLTNGLRVRAGPSTGYPVLANAPINSVVPVLGRTASSGWVQVNFEGTLGWVATRYLEIQNGFSLATLPIDGIVAESLPLSQPVEDDYLATLRLMISRVDLAQPSLDSIRASWTDSALTGRASCRPFPARPSDYNIPNELLAAFYNTLDPLQTLFNDAMANVRLSIDLFIEVCEQTGTVNAVGQGTVIGALGVVSLADNQFAELRRRITDLIPADQEIGEDQCLFTFQGSSDILSVIVPGIITLDSLNPEKRATGYCVDLLQGQSIVVEVLQLEGSNITPLVSVSPFDNPTNFVGTGSSSQGVTLLTLGPISITATARYLIALSNFIAPEGALNGNFAVLVTVIPPGTSSVNYLTLDPVTGQPVSSAPIATPDPNQPTTPLLPVVTLTPPNTGFSVDGNISPGGGAGTAVCPGTGLSCEQLASCEEAYACLDAGNFSLDPDDDGVPCEVTRCPANN